MKRTLTIFLAAVILAGGVLIGMNIGGVDMADKAQAESLTEAVSASIVSITLNPYNNRYYVRYSDSQEYEFASVQAMTDWAAEMQSVENAKRLVIAWWLARDDDASNTSLVIGKTLTLNLSSPSPIKVQ